MCLNTVEISRLKLKFWGVRGSTPTPQIENMSYGGNTPCLEVRVPGDEVFVLDAGSGARNLGVALLEEFRPQKLSINLFLTHFHWDHIQGIPFFLPLYREDNSVTFYSSSSCGSTKELLERHMAAPFFPVSFEAMAAQRRFVDLDSNSIRFGSLTIHPFPVNHPQGAIGYRLESSSGAAIVYATDLEHGHQKLDKVLRDYSQKADVLIYDAQYTPEEYENHRGWGHSTWLEAAHVAKDAQAKQLILFHHDPYHNDQTVSRLVDHARRLFENTLAAREGATVTL